MTLLPTLTRIRWKKNDGLEAGLNSSVPLFSPLTNVKPIKRLRRFIHSFAPPVRLNRITELELDE